MAGIVQGKDVLLMVETSIALAVASIPEGLPIVATIALARGMYRMAQRNALVISSETQWLWHTLDLEPAPAARIRFLECRLTS